jgi:hypothetical protein
MGKDSGSTQTSTQTAGPWKGAEPFVTDYLNQGQAQFNKPFSFNPGDQIAPFSPEQQYGLAGTTQRAINGSPVNLAAQNNATATLNGDFMSPDSNQWLKGAYDTAADAETGRINSIFNNNNFGGTAHQETLGKSLTELGNNIYGGNYQQERGRQMSAMGMAPQLAETDYRDMQALLGVGDARQGLAQKYMNQQNDLWNGKNNYGQNQLDNYGNVVRTGMGAGQNSTTTSPNPNQSSGIANLIGGGLSIAGLMSGGGMGLLGGLF